MYPANSLVVVEGASLAKVLDEREAFHRRVFEDLSRFLPIVTRRLQLPLVLESASEILLPLDPAEPSKGSISAFRVTLHAGEGESMTLPIAGLNDRTIAVGKVGAIKDARWGTRWVFANEVRHHPWSLGMFELVIRRWRVEHWQRDTHADAAQAAVAP